MKDKYCLDSIVPFQTTNPQLTVRRPNKPSPSLNPPVLIKSRQSKVHLI